MNKTIPFERARKVALGNVGARRQENRSACLPGEGTEPAARCSTATHGTRAVERAEWLP